MGSIVNPGGGGGSGDVSAAANLTDNAVVIGDGGAKGVQTIADGLGTSGQVLTSNGAGSEPTWEDAPSGGGASQFDATVGSTGADYTDIQAAITGVGGTDIKLLLITDVTEDSDVTMPSGSVFIHLANNTLTMGSNSFTGTNGDLTIVGNGYAMGSEIDWTPTSTNQVLFAAGGSTTVLTIKNLLFDNNASANNTRLTDGITVVDNCKVELSNQTVGFYDSDSSESCVTNTWIVGGGSSCGQVIRGSGGKFNNLYFTGQFYDSSTIDTVLFSGEGVVVSNVIFDHSSNEIALEVDGEWSNIRNISSEAINVSGFGTNASLSNWELGNGNIDLGSNTNIRLNNIILTGSLDMSDSGASNNLLNNIRVTGAVTFGGDRNKISNCEFLGGASVSSTGANNLFANCQFGPDGGGGALTLTFDASSAGNNAVGCIADAAMVDNGTGNAQDYILY